MTRRGARRREEEVRERREERRAKRDERKKKRAQKREAEGKVLKLAHFQRHMLATHAGVAGKL